MRDRGYTLMGRGLSLVDRVFIPRWAVDRSVISYERQDHLGPTEKEQIEVQGDIAYDIVEFITETWPDVISSYHVFY
ncbi:hypothetical protein ACLOJK_037891 [Asimina triloba]